MKAWSRSTCRPAPGRGGANTGAMGIERTEFFTILPLPLTDMNELTRQAGSRRLTRWIAMAALFIIAGCSTPRSVDERITVSGEVTARGNEPFSRYVLETNQQMLYVLDIPPEQIEGFSTPAHIRVKGRLYRDDWNGIPFAHIEVEEWEADD